MTILRLEKMRIWALSATFRVAVPVPVVGPVKPNVNVKASMLALPRAV